MVWIMEKGYVVYTAGQRGVTTARYARAVGISVVGFFDNDLQLQGKVVDGLEVWNRKALSEGVWSGKIIGIIIGNDAYKNQIIEAINQEFGTELEIIEEDCVQKRYWHQDVIPFRKHMEDRYDVLYEEQAQVWLDNIMSEVEYWSKNVASPRCKNYELYRKRMNQDKLFECKRLKKKVKSGTYIVDAGCGICSQYGMQVEYGQVHLVGVDPLAFFYNRINHKVLGDIRDSNVKFGMFEFLSSFIEIESADIVLIDNALDHCIDPFKSILECLAILKKNGILSMRHRRCEAVFEGYAGLHKWNIDVDDENKFIIWNEKNKINISDTLKGYVDIEVDVLNGVRRSDEYVEINITKRQSFDTHEFYNMQSENRRMARIIQGCMRLMADSNINLKFEQMLEEI